MKRNEILLAVFLLMVGILISGCSIDDATIEIPTGQTTQTGDMTFTASVEAKSPATRSVDADGVTTWVVNEKIAVYYQKTNNSYGTATANVDEVNEGKAIISATLTDAKDDTEVKFVYPATLTNATGDDIDAAKLATQHGTIADISANFDAATATATLKTDGTICGTTATINFTNRVLIGKFTPKFSGVAINAISTLTVTDGTQTYTVTPSSGTFGTTGIYVAMLPVSSKRVRITAANASQTYVFSKSVTLEAGKLYNNLAFECYLQDIDLATLTGDCTALDGQVLTGTLTSKVKISIASHAVVTLNGATINGVNELTYPWAGLTCEGDATIILADGSENTVTGFYKDYPGIQAGPVGSTLTISGTGSLNASSKCDGAGIGAGYNFNCGNIRIEGGDITAMGGKLKDIGVDGSGSGIGSGSSHNGQSNCGEITITGGKVKAFGGRAGGAGIGSGRTEMGQSACGNINISGGTVMAYGCYTNSNNSGGAGGAGIGSGSAIHEYNGVYGQSTCGNINISGGKVTANGGINGAGIGTGESSSEGLSSCDHITITGGEVLATGGWNGTGIGCGMGENLHPTVCGNISITKGTDFVSVTAIRGNDVLGAIGNKKIMGENDGSTICGTITFGNHVVYGGDPQFPYYLPDESDDLDGLHFEVNTTVPAGEDNEDHGYDDNTWKLIQ